MPTAASGRRPPRRHSRSTVGAFARAKLKGLMRAEEEDGQGRPDSISDLPDAVLGDIVSRLPTRAGARTGVLSSRWRHIWRSSPLNLDLRSHPVPLCKVPRILSAHPGPGRRFCIPPHHLHDRPATVDAWLRSPALDNLQELDFCDYWFVRPFPPARPPESTFRFSATLRVATFTKCLLLDSSVEALRFPQLKQLALQYVCVSGGSLHTMISSCPVLECLLLKSSYGFRCVQIISSSLRSIGLGGTHDVNKTHLREFIIVDAPCLERLLFLQQYAAINVSVIAAPKLETLGCLTGDLDALRLVFGSTTIQGLQVINLTTVVRNVKILAVEAWPINLDVVIDLLKCFPCLEKLYIKGCISGEMNRWSRKHRQFIKCFDICLKTVVLEMYRGIRSQVNFASFFLLNASKLELMTLEVENRADNEAFFAEQYRLLQMDKRASRSARLHFTTDRCIRDVHVNHVRDLAITDPFKCRCRH